VTTKNTEKLNKCDVKKKKKKKKTAKCGRGVG
jgi:hypothetical protein